MVKVWFSVMKKNIELILTATLLSLSVQQIQAQVLPIDVIPNPHYNVQYERIYYNGDTLKLNVIPKNAYHHKPKKYKTEKADDTYDIWYQRYMNNITPMIERHMMRIVLEQPHRFADPDPVNKKENHDDFVRILKILKERYYADNWKAFLNEKREAYYSKNARSAFCQYGKDIYLIEMDKPCDASFELNPNIFSSYESLKYYPKKGIPYKHK